MYNAMEREIQGARSGSMAVLVYLIIGSGSIISKQGSTFPGAQGHMPLHFAVDPRFFRLGARNSIYNNTEILF